MYYERLTSKVINKRLINSFFIARERDYAETFRKTGEIYGLEQYLKHSAWDDDIFNETRIYLIKTRCSREVVAYFGLKAGMISVDSSNRDKNEERLALKKGIKLVPDTVSGIEISHFAINDNYRVKHGKKGKPITHLGEYLYPKFIYPIIQKVAKQIGVKIVYLYAADTTHNNSLVKYYKKTFEFDTISDVDNLTPVTSYYDNNCVFMYQFI